MTADVKIETVHRLTEKSIALLFLGILFRFSM